jgi:hypothetical protein
VPALHEIRDVRQIPGEHRRRWFASSDMDLIVWVDGGGAPLGFQLCYDKGRFEKALTSAPGGELTHAMVDDGEGARSGLKETPVLVSSAYFDGARLQKLVADASAEVPREFVDLVGEKIRQYGARPKA